MARSILPSTHPVSSRRRKAGIKQHARRSARQQTSAWQRDPDSYDDAGGVPYPEAEIHGAKRMRRGDDKVNPIGRWGAAVTLSLPRDQRLDWLRSVLPKNLIGRHALHHLQWHPALRPTHLDRERRGLRRTPRPDRMDRGEQAALLRELLVLPGMHRAFNRWLQEHRSLLSNGAPRPRARPLQGLHDVLPFLDATDRCPRCHDSHDPEARRAMLCFLGAFKCLRLSAEALLRYLRQEHS